MGPRCACRGEVVVVWYYDFDIAEDANLTKGDMHPARTPISTPPRVPRCCGGQEVYRGLSFCLIGGQRGGGKGG